jgi:hypothetical protein
VLVLRKIPAADPEDHHADSLECDAALF